MALKQKKNLKITFLLYKTLFKYVKINKVRIKKCCL